MNLFALTIWAMALLPLAGHLFCLSKLRRIALGPSRNNARSGLLRALLIVVLNLFQLLTWNLHTGYTGLPGVILIVLPVTAALLSIGAIARMRRSGDFDVLSIGITGTVLSLFSMASIVLLGSMTLAG